MTFNPTASGSLHYNCCRVARPLFALVSVTLSRRGSPRKPTFPWGLARTVVTMITSWRDLNQMFTESARVACVKHIANPHPKKILMVHALQHPHDHMPWSSFSRPWKPSTLLTSTFNPDALAALGAWRRPGAGQPRKRRRSLACAA